MTECVVCVGQYQNYCNTEALKQEQHRTAIRFTVHISQTNQSKIKQPHQQ